LLSLWLISGQTNKGKKWEEKRGKVVFFCFVDPNRQSGKRYCENHLYTHSLTFSHTHTHRGAREREENPVKSKAN